MNRWSATGVVLFFLAVFGTPAFFGCSDVTGPRVLTSFDWGEVEDPEAVVTGIASEVVLGELIILGQFNTPTRCYRLNADFQTGGKTLKVTVNAKSTDSPNCDERLGGFRYTAVMRNLEFGTYDLRVIHNVTPGEGGEYSKTVTIR